MIFELCKTTGRLEKQAYNLDRNQDKSYSALRVQHWGDKWLSSFFSPLCTGLAVPGEKELFSESKQGWGTGSSKINFPKGSVLYPSNLWQCPAQSCATLWEPMGCSPPGSSVYEISRQEYWSGLPFPSPGDLHDPGVEPTFATWQADSLPLGHQRSSSVLKKYKNNNNLNACLYSCIRQARKKPAQEYSCLPFSFVAVVPSASPST